ncbi:hypothetical protein SVIOM342S_06002 [Streptomyces violaceorubidus]
MLHHQKAEDGNGKLNRGLERHFAPEDDFDRWHYLAQVVQARAIATGIEHWRCRWPVCAGTVVWQINDCWRHSWAAIDGDGRLKPLYHELRRVYADRLLTLQPGDGDDGPVLAVVNQAAEPWQTRVTLRRLRADGVEVAEHVLDVTVAARFRAPAGRAAGPWPPHRGRPRSSSSPTARTCGACASPSRTGTSPTRYRATTWPWSPRWVPGRVMSRSW